MNDENKVINIDEYVAAYSEEIEERMAKIRRTIHETIDNLEEKISWAMPTFKYKGKNLIHFAGHKNHIGIYPGDEAIDYYKDDLKDYSYTKGAIQFPNTKEIDFELIKKLALFNKEKIDKISPKKK